MQLLSQNSLEQRQSKMRPTKPQVFLEMAKVLANLGTCSRRKVGCILTDVHNRVLSTGYNGVAKGQVHCIDKQCPGAVHASGSGTSLYLCEAIHAEQNALLQCKDVDAIYNCYVTCSPCIQCVKLLMNTPCRHIYFTEPHSHDEKSRQLWRGSEARRTWNHMSWENIDLVHKVLLEEAKHE